MNWKTALLVCVVVAVSAPSGEADSLPRQLQQHVPRILEYLQDRGHTTVGVLKFRVQKHGERASDRVGPLNSLIADRLEVGLILANPFDEARQLQIIRDASAQARQRGDVSHLDAAGRAAFFESPYSLAWGQQQRQADAFLTGVVQVHEDGARCTVGILAFDRTGGPLERCCPVFDADLDSTTLGELGESYLLRGAFDSGATNLTQPKTQSGKSRNQTQAARTPADIHATSKNRQQQTTVAKVAKVANVAGNAVSAAHAVRTQMAAFPLLDPKAPVKLEVRYDGQVVPFEMRHGKAFLPEPEQGQQVELTIVRGPSATGVLGVVLRVNGENTLGRQTLSDIECRKWLLTTDHTRTAVRGYQVGDNERESFCVLSESESRRRAVDYGRYLGQIQLTVFREASAAGKSAHHRQQPPPTPAPLSDEQEEDLAAMLRGVQPTESPANLSVLKGLLRNPTVQTRGGLLVPGARTVSKIRTLAFEPDPTPVMSATVTYYTP